eukprot:8784878-Karenia_brevis.AAC.1
MQAAQVCDAEKELQQEAAEKHPESSELRTNPKLALKLYRQGKKKQEEVSITVFQSDELKTLLRCMIAA